MKKKLSTKQQINAELASRSFNQRAKKIIKSSNPEHALAGITIDFVCECSDETCQERVALTIEQYEKIHDDHARFVLTKGHELPPVDKVKSTTNSFVIVEKPALNRR